MVLFVVRSFDFVPAFRAAEVGFSSAIRNWLQRRLPILILYSI